MMESPTLRQAQDETRKTNRVPLDSFADDAVDLPSEDGVIVADEVQIGKPQPQPWWIRAWQLCLLLAALWYAFLGGRGVFHQLDSPIVDFFVGVVIVWMIYHYVLAPRFNWPPLPLG